MGCLFNSISFFSAFLVLLAGWFLFPLTFQRPYLFYGGTISVAISLLSSAIGLTENMKVKILAKFLLGGGFASLCVSILITGDDLLVNIEAKVLAILILYLPVMTVMNAKRMWEIEKECQDCDFKMRWSRCPGFKDIVCKAIDAGFVRPREKHVPTQPSDEARST